MIKANFDRRFYAFLLTLTILLAGIVTFSSVKKEEIKATTWLNSSEYYETTFRNSGGKKVTNGNSLNSHYISTAAELAGLAYLINSSSYYNNYKSDNFYLLDNINLTGYDWVPIGTSDRPFEGKFYGKGKAISGLTIRNSNSYVGLFGYLSNARVENLLVEGSISFSFAKSYISGVAGYAQNSTFVGIANGVSIRTVNSTYVGSIVGGYSLALEISKSYNTATSVIGKSYVGGLVGGATNTNTSYKISIKDVYNNSNVEGVTIVGGIIGSADGSGSSSIQAAYNNGIIKSTSDYLGGIAGITLVKVEGVINYAKVEGGSNSNHVGGIMGSGAGTSHIYLDNKASVSGRASVGGISGSALDNLTLKDAYNFGRVEGTGSYIGGILGHASGTAIHIEEALNTGTVKGDTYIGGISGGGRSQSMKFVDVANEGNVTAKGNYAGGILGASFYEKVEVPKAGSDTVEKKAFKWFHPLILTASPINLYDRVLAIIINWGWLIKNNNYVYYYAKVDMTRTYNIGTIDGTDYRGGLAGYIYVENNNGGTIKDSYNSGVIKSYTKAEEYYSGIWPFGSYKTRLVPDKNSYVGSLIGRNHTNNHALSNLYYLKETSTPDAGLGTNNGSGTSSKVNSSSSKSALNSSFTSSSQWVYASAGPRITYIDYSGSSSASKIVSEVKSRFFTSYWDMSGTSLKNNGMPYLKSFFW